MEQDVGYKLKLITDKLKVRADADLKRHKLTLSQSRVMAFLNKKGGEATQKEIEDNMQVSHPTVVGIVSRMEQNGFLETWFDPADRRNKMVRLTEKAHQLGRILEQVTKEHERILLRSFSPVEEEELKHMLDRILRNIE